MTIEQDIEKQCKSRPNDAVVIVNFFSSKSYPDMNVIFQPSDKRMLPAKFKVWVNLYG